MPNKNNFTFEISLSVLNHLGRNLYRSFNTVLGEAISNSWDADAEDVWLFIERESNSFIIMDDGKGMTADDFQNKFLKIGYSKRKDGAKESGRGRPFIGRKGIGKLALLSCAEKITVISKTEKGDYVGGEIDNSGLDRAIKDDLTPDQYLLGKWEESIFRKYTSDHPHGTIIHFKNIKDGIINRIDYLKRAIALYFRFSLIDKSFKIYVGTEQITLDHLKGLAEKTEFAWKINDLKDPFLDNQCNRLKEPIKNFALKANIRGFIASVEKPRNLKILSTDEKVGVDLFVNGRLRERDILKHMPTARVAESYLYGQIHFDEMDDDVDRFATAREGIVSEDPKFKDLLDVIKSDVIGKILDEWDEWRRKHRKDGDSENDSIPKKQRKSEELFNAVSEEYDFPEGSPNKAKVDKWSDDLKQDAIFNFSSYADCFISENLIRKYIHDRNIPLADPEKNIISDLKGKEGRNKIQGNININLRQDNDGLGYLDMDPLARIVDPQKGGPACGLSTDAKQYKPIRDALMHTALLTQEAKKRLSSVYDDIKGRLKKLLVDGNSNSN
jgi:hypothetical protein